MEVYILKQNLRLGAPDSQDIFLGGWGVGEGGGRRNLHYTYVSAFFWSRNSYAIYPQIQS